MNNIAGYALARKEIISNRAAVYSIGVAGFIILTALGAFVRIPLGFTPVPFTLQTFFVLLSGCILGRKLGLVSQAGYMLTGIAGLPIFASGSAGSAYILGPTGGYIIGFIAAAYIIGKIIEKKSSLVGMTLALICGEALILGIGSLWLSVSLHMNIRQALLLGAVPFIAGDILKILACLLIARPYLVRAKQIFYSL